MYENRTGKTTQSRRECVCMIYYDEEFLSTICSKVNMLEYAEANGFEFTRQGTEFYTHCPLHTDKTPSLCISQNNPEKFFCFSCRTGGGIINWLMKIDGMGFREAVKKASEIAEVDISTLFKSTTIKYIRAASKRKGEIPLHTLLPNDFMQRFSDAPIVEWEKEGISRKTIRDFGIRLDEEKNRIVYPVYSSDGKLINVKGRTLFENYKDLKIPKYTNYYKVGSIDYLQGIQNTKKYIIEAGEVILFESIKSVMKAWDYGYKNSVSIESHGITFDQLKLIIQLGVNVVLAFDKDVDINEGKLKSSLDKIKTFTNVYIIKDNDSLLEEKDAPVDRGKEKWERLYNEKVRYI